MKKKLLIIGIIMNNAGTEKSFLSFANCLDYDKYDVDLLLAKKEGMFLSMIPSQINVIEMDELGDLFLMSGANAAKTLWNTVVKKNPLSLFEILPYFIKIVLSKSKRSATATKLWCKMMGKMKPLEEHYDVAAAYWGDRTMFYMCDKVNADKKIAWLHFDYANPPRDDQLYLSYFERCDNIVTVSQKINDVLCEKLPEIADRCVMMENINDPSLVRELSMRGDTYPDAAFSGKRILSVGRISYQKGYDMILPVIRRLSDDGYDFRWYILGGGDQADIDELKVQAVDAGVADRLILLGVTDNPYTYIRDCDIYVQPSRYEGKPITVEEAKMLYKPIVITDYLSAAEQLAGGEYGIITDISSDGIYSGVKKMLDDEALADAFSEKLFKKDFGNTSEIEKFYRMAGDKN